MNRKKLLLLGALMLIFLLLSGFVYLTGQQAVSEAVSPHPAPTITNTPLPIPVYDRDGIYRPIYSRYIVYCDYPPREVKVTVFLDDIERGMAVYYRLKEKSSGKETAWDKVDLHRDGPDARSGMIRGGKNADIEYPPGWGESWIKMQVITDTGDYRSDFYFDVTYVPCHP